MGTKIDYVKYLLDKTLELL